MNLVREIKQYQATDGTCFNTREEAEQYEEMLQNPHFKKLQERIEKLESKLIALQTEVCALKTPIRLNPDVYPWQQPQVKFPPMGYQVYNNATGKVEQ